ncbi:MAG: tRNA pseudouridine(54/55) synthase Pus10 [Candidatus Bathyarchaeia archaeon]
MDILEKAQRMLTDHPLCNHCLGRQFALLGHGVENKNRGRAIKLLLTMKGHQFVLSKNKAGVTLLKTVAVNGSFDTAYNILKSFNKRTPAKKRCFLCEGRFENINMIADKAIRKLKDYEFATFLVGVELPLEVAEREDEFKASFNVTHGESMKSQFSRDIGKRICEITSKEVDYGKPDVVVLVNPFTNRIRLQINPLYVSGRYRKLVRGIPQSRWLCRECSGKGCEHCNWTGKKYQESVEEFIGIPMLEMTEGGEISFHGAGREDVDARMLGSGRPFVLEVKEPKKRFINLLKLEQTINKYAKGKVEVHNLCFADKDVVRRFKKAEAAEKIYSAIIEFDRDVSDDELERVEKMLSNVFIRQQTPQRVLHRRADLTREKYIYEAKIKRMSRNRAEMQIHCQGGLYIKELVTGDEGRTKPSVASILDAKVTPVQLDVLGVVGGEEKNEKVERLPS